MASTPELASCVGERAGALLPVNPFQALLYHFGMLLGVVDLEEQQGYHHGKTRLHNAWLHGEGVVWGFGVEVRADTRERKGEIRVLPGLALDAAGRELHLDEIKCLDVAAWAAAHKDDDDLLKAVNDYRVEHRSRLGAGAPAPDTMIFDAHVVVRFHTCLTRAVPAIAGGACDGASTAHSRVLETVEILLRPGKAPQRAEPYRRLRLLFHLDPPGVGKDDQEVILRRNQILQLYPEERPAAYLEAFRRFAPLDEMDLAPAKGGAGLFPRGDDAEVVLAQIDGITLEKRAFTRFGAADTSVRPVHVATSTIQELLSGPLFATRSGATGGGGTGGGATGGGTTGGSTTGGGTTGGSATGSGAACDVGGPRVKPNITLYCEGVTIELTKPLLRASVTVNAFSVTRLDKDGWHPVLLRRCPDLRADGMALRLSFIEPPAGLHLRLIVRGTGPTPLLGADFVPLAGAEDGAPGGADDGHDFVFTARLKG